MMALLLMLGSFAEGAEAPLPEVTIEGQRKELEQRVHEYVFGLTQGPVGTSDDPLQRWRAPICFIVAGLPRPEGEFVLQRVSAAADSAGAPLAKQEHCKHPNFYIVFTGRPRELLQMWRRHDPSMYGFAAPMGMNKFVDAPTPVRTWYNTELEEAQRGTSENGAFDITASGNSGFNNSGLTDVTSVKGDASRIEYNVVRNFWSTIVLVDLNKVKGVDLSAIADYVAMVGLARVHVSADISSAPTILNLFTSSDRPAPTALTSWDKSFLKALYATPQELRGQRTKISEQMLHDIVP